MLAPVAFVVTSPPHPNTVIAVVVVLPLVPLISITVRPRAKRASKSGQIHVPTVPPATVPEPRPRARERRFTARTAETAARCRRIERERTALTLTSQKTQKDQPGGGWSFCKTLVLGNGGTSKNRLIPVWRSRHHQSSRYQ